MQKKFIIAIIFNFLLINNSFAVTGNGEIKLSQNVISGYMSI